MNSRFIITFIAIATFSMNALALEGKSFKILSEKIESSPGLVGGFISKPTSPQIPGKSFLVQAWSQAHDSQGRVHNNIRLWGNHHFSISNYTKTSQTYIYKYELNCDGQYFRKIDHIEVAPGGYVTDSADSFLYTEHSHGGLWTINVATVVEGESSNSHVATGTLRVTN